jgi:lipopolysaccharide transport protein LptA
MTRIIASALLLAVASLHIAKAQDSTANALTSPSKAKEEKNPGKPKSDDKKQGTDPLRQAFAGGLGSDPKVPTTTEILADQAFFDSGKSIGIFSGHVIVKDPRFNLQADKLTVYLGKGEVQGLDHAVAEGNVGMVREAPREEGGPPMRSVGRSDTAVYTAATGNVELRGTPRVQSGLNSHIATSPDTVMVINQSGQLTTTGPSRTELHQQPKGSPAPPKP